VARKASTHVHVHAFLISIEVLGLEVGSLQPFSRSSDLLSPFGAVRTRSGSRVPRFKLPGLLQRRRDQSWVQEAQAQGPRPRLKLPALARPLARRARRAPPSAPGPRDPRQSSPSRAALLRCGNALSDCNSKEVQRHGATANLWPNVKTPPSSARTTLCMPQQLTSTGANARPVESSAAPWA
jgi:hypothetical protein